MSSNNSRKWTSDKTIKFLQMYEQFPCLWDVRLKEYKNKESRDEACVRISDLMDIEGFDYTDVKAKIRSIRNAYGLEVTKVIRSKKSGGEVYKPKVAWFQVADSILRHVVQVKEAVSIKMDRNDFSKCNKSDENVDSSTEMEDELVPPLYVDLQSASGKWESESKRVKRSLSSTYEPNNSNYDNNTKNTNEDPEERKYAQPEEDEFDYFGKSVACQLKKLPESMALESIAYIQSYLVQQRLNNILQRSKRTDDETGQCSSSSNLTK